MSSSVVSIVMFFIFAAVMSILMIKESVPRKLFVIIPAGIAFGLLAILPISALNNIETIFMDTQGVIHVVFVAPIQEELSKWILFFCAFEFIDLLNRRMQSCLIKGMKPLVFLGAFIGLAFALVENMTAYSNLTDLNTLERVLVAWPMHIFTITLSAYGFFKRIINAKIGILVLFLLLAIFIHSVYNLIMVLI